MSLPLAKDLRILDCGHYPSPHSDFSTGTARTTNDREICWDCADLEQQEALKAVDRYTAYLGSDGKSLQTWSGGRLARVVHLWESNIGFGNMGFRFNAVDDHGQKWYGTSPGKGMYCRMRKAKS